MGDGSAGIYCPDNYLSVTEIRGTLSGIDDGNRSA
jgi:hypothetical protein